MRVVILGTAHPFRGGLAAFNERLATAFIEEGHEVEVVTFTLQYPNFLFPGESQKDDRPAPVGYKIHQKLNSVNPISYVTTGQFIKSLKPDLIIAKFWLPFMGPSLGTALRIAKKSGAKVISIIDNIVPHESRIGDKVFAQYFSNTVDHFIVMSRAVEKQMESFVKKNQQVVFHPHPIYDNFGEAVSKQEAIKYLDLDPKYSYALFFGFIRDYKGLDLLLDAMALLPKELNVKLIVAGEFYGNKDKYMNQIEKLNISEKLVLKTDFIPNDQVKYFFSAADVVVQPYKTATQSGISQMAFHFQKPMIVTKVGGLPEIVPDGKAGYVVDTDSNAIAGAIQKFYSLNKEDEMVKQVAKLAEQYKWPALINLMNSLAKL